MHPEVWEKEMSQLMSYALDGREIHISIGENALIVTAAARHDSRVAGLANKPLDQLTNDGMIFIYPGDYSAAFDMSAMLFPIQIYFFDAAGELVHSAHSDDDTEARSPVNYRYVVELADNPPTDIPRPTSWLLDGNLSLHEVLDD